MFWGGIYLNVFKMVTQAERGNPLRDLNPRNMAAGIVTSLLAIAGPPAIILEAAVNGNFSTYQTILWFFAIYVGGGIFGIILPLRYRMPIVGAHSITGVAFLATVTSQFTYSELIGAYLLSGLLILAVGTLGTFSKLLDYVPKEIISAMLAGMVTKYMINFIVSTSQFLLVGGGALLAFLFFSKANTRIPPILAAIITGSILLLLSHNFGNTGMATDFIFPQAQVPEFGLASFLSVAVPLALLILSNDCAVGLGALEQNDYHPPVNRIVTLSGIFSVIAGIFGGQSANIGGMMTAICAAEEAGPKEARYMGAVVSGSIILIFGLFAWKFVPWIQALPSAFIGILGGFALLGVYINSLQISFSRPSMKLSVTFAFMIALANITILNISAPVWSLLAGTIIARYVEKS
ncbi:benzoate/H(+) symporter BenE family transporter [Sporomusa sphaeroides]|uniref:Inner membrane protein YdcO n=2 Tax=Sporomusaceae TaxID=1843490 RepID=A0ABM9W126_9FIRM|nr:inner membrane protein YdcO [Sporomusa sphaeroides DSM 2875]CVK18862.1 Inner membrane protein YdcO [Sporomusa sphaeroides DSM 2875]